jgi:hypothetical protein
MDLSSIYQKTNIKLICFVYYLYSKTALKYLNDVATKQAFKPWELADNVPRIRYELASRAPQTRALNLLHRAAFRTGLGNSVFCPKYLIGKIGTETVSQAKTTDNREVSSNFYLFILDSWTKYIDTCFLLFF